MQIWSTILFVNLLQSLNAGHKNENQQPKIFNSWWFIGHWPQVPALLKKAHAIRNQSCTIQKHEGKFQGFALCISSGEVVYGSHFYFFTWRVPLTFVCFFAVSFMLILLQILTILFLSRILKFKQVQHSRGLFGFMLQLPEMFLFIYLYIMKWRVPVILNTAHCACITILR